MVKKSVLCLFVFTLACSTALFAADHKPLISGKATHVIPATRQAPPPSAAKLIYSNLGPTAEPYQLNGFLVLGPGSVDFGESQFIGVPFTVKGATKFAGLRAPIQYGSSIFPDPGDNYIQMCLYSDASGVAGPPTAPGTQIGNCVAKSNLPVFGTAYPLTTFVFESQNLALASGFSYWIVSQEPSSGTGADSEMVWDWETDTNAYNVAGDGWNTEFAADTQGAVAVYGF